MPEASSKPYQISKMMRRIEKPGIVRTVCSSISKDVQGYLEILMPHIFRDIDIHPHSQACRYWGEGGFPFFSFFFFFCKYKIEKKCFFHFGKKALMVFIFVLNFPFKMQFSNLQNVSLRGLFFLVFLTKCLSKYPSSPKPPLP